jgi:hypothetical protein
VVIVVGFQKRGVPGAKVGGSGCKNGRRFGVPMAEDSGRQTAEDSACKSRWFEVQKGRRFGVQKRCKMVGVWWMSRVSDVVVMVRLCGSLFFNEVIRPQWVVFA